MRASGAQVWVFPCEQCGDPARYKFAKMAKRPRCATCKRKMVLARQAIRGRQRTLARSDVEVLLNKRRGLAYSFAEHREWMDANGLGHLFEEKRDA